MFCLINCNYTFLPLQMGYKLAHEVAFGIRNREARDKSEGRDFATFA